MIIKIIYTIRKFSIADIYLVSVELIFVSFVNSVGFIHINSASKNLGTLKPTAQNTIDTMYLSRLIRRNLALIILCLCVIGYLMAMYLSCAIPTVIKIDKVKLMLEMGYVNFG